MQAGILSSLTYRFYNRRVSGVSEMKVLHIAGNGFISGVGVHLLSLVRQQMPYLKECRVAIWGKGGAISEQINNMGVEVDIWNCKSGHDFRLLLNFQKIIASFRPDIVHMHNLPIFGSIPARLSRYPIVTTFHVKNNRSCGIANKAYGNSIKGVIAVSNTLRKSCLEQGLFPKAKWVVIYNGIDIAHFSPDPVFGYPAGNGKQFDFIAVTRFAKDKHIENAVEIVNILHSKYGINLKLRLVGSGDQEEFLRQRVDALKLNECVHFAGEFADPSSILKKSHGFFMLSEYETFAIGALEAAACGTPIFSYPVRGGINEWLKDGIGGVVSKDRTPDSLAEKTAGVLSRCEYWQSLRTSARETAVEFTEEKTAKKTLSFYEDIIKNK